MNSTHHNKLNNTIDDEDIPLSKRREIEKIIKAIRATPQGENTFFDQRDFPWVKDVEDDWAAIRRELDALLNAAELLPAFQEIQVEQYDISSDRQWRIFPLCAYGWWPESSAKRCPATVNALKKIPGLQAAIFSIFKPGKHVPPHLGPYCGVLRYHLGVKVPQNHKSCGIRVGKDTEHWQQGKSLIFDDSHDHEAWNHSDETRVVLFVDFERPLDVELQKLNRQVIESIQESDFIANGKKRFLHWEQKYGKELDKILGIA
jgi:ornithine lipid ester-linked acyl 2-hydroxylase